MVEGHAAAGQETDRGDQLGPLARRVGVGVELALDARQQRAVEVLAGGAFEHLGPEVQITLRGRAHRLLVGRAAAADLVEIEGQRRLITVQGGDRAVAVARAVEVLDGDDRAGQREHGIGQLLPTEGHAGVAAHAQVRLASAPVRRADV